MHCLALRVQYIEIKAGRNVVRGEMQLDRYPYWRARRAGPLALAQIIASRITSQALSTHASCSYRF